jgi:hypothetical protein
MQLSADENAENIQYADRCAFLEEMWNKGESTLMLRFWR